MFSSSVHSVYCRTMKLAILSLCFLLVGFACAAPAREQAVRNKRSADNELAELQDFLSQLANLQQDEEEGAIQQDEKEPDQASIEELLSYLQQDEEEPDQATIEELLSYAQQEEPDEKAMMQGWFKSLARKAKKFFKSRGFRRWVGHAVKWYRTFRKYSGGRRG